VVVLIFMPLNIPQLIDIATFKCKKMSFFSYLEEVKGHHFSFTLHTELYHLNTYTYRE